MADKTYIYEAFRYQPRTDADQKILQFVAPASEIREWAGVPRKAFDYQHGFQRSLSPQRVTEVSRYFAQDPRNVSPTSVVVGFTGDVKLEVLPPRKLPPGARDLGEQVLIRVTVPDYSETPVEELTALALKKLEERLSVTTVAEIKADVQTAAAAAGELQDTDAVDESFGITAEETAGLDESAMPDRSYLEDFYAQLLAYSQGLVTWPNDKQLREVLYSIIKPAIIVDGQHRIFGAANISEDLRLSVCALPDATWAESVFQFVVINQKAKPIKPAFLSSIVATSLGTDEIDVVYERLKDSRVDVGRADTMERVNTDPRSPFKGMIDFEVEGTVGFLQFPGMSKLVSEFFHIPRSHPVLLPNGLWAGVEGEWIEYFFALWTGVRKTLETADPRLWMQPSDANPNNLLKIVTLQEVQRFMLDTWADSRFIKFTTPQEVQTQAAGFWEEFPSTFFTDEWRKKGLQTSVGRSILRSALTETRRFTGRKNWGHRRLGLFSE
jgi:hypothetical protein